MKIYVSEFAKNLMNKGAIVCPCAVGPSVLLTENCFSSKQEFEHWKSVSDEDYRLRERAERRETLHTIPDSFAAASSPASPSAERVVLSAIEEAERRTRLQVLLEPLTSSQRRRLLLLLDGMNIKEIAATEGVTPSAAAKSIRLAKRRLAASISP